MPRPPGKWTLCLLLFFATTLNYLDRQTLSILAPAMRTELGLDNHSLGLLFAAFYYSYTIAQFAAGGLLDQCDLRWAYALGVLAWSAVAAMTATATRLRFAYGVPASAWCGGVSELAGGNANCGALAAASRTVIRQRHLH